MSDAAVCECTLCSSLLAQYEMNNLQTNQSIFIHRKIGMCAILKINIIKCGVN